MLISLIGTWIQIVAQSWLVFELTHSAFLLGLVGFLGSIGIFVLSLFGGVVADRINKKTVLLFTQNAFMILAFILAWLTQMKLITPLHIMLIAALNGAVMAFDAPSRQAVVVELVGRDNLLNAIALNSAAFNAARMVGPALAGILISAIGMSGCFYINGISFLAVIIALWLIKINGDEKRNATNHVFKDLLEGLSFIRNNRIILILVAMVSVSSLFGISYVILMPIFANDILRSGVKGLAALMSSAGIGALIAALGLASSGDFKHKGRFLVFASIIFSASLVVFSLSCSFWLSIVLLVLIGCSSVTAMSLINTLLQTLVPDSFRGRVMSIFMLAFAGLMPFGNLIAGFLAHTIGVSLAVMFGGFLCGVFFTTVGILCPDIRNI